MKRLDFFLLPFAMDIAVAMAQIMVNLRALDLGASATTVGVLMGLCWGVPYMLAALTTGTMVARFGARTMMLVGAAAFGAGTAAYGFAISPWQLLVAAPVAGGGSGIFWPALQTYLKVDDANETRIRSGIFNVSWTCGILTGVGISGHAYRLAGPRWSFWLAAMLVGGALIIIAARVRPQRVSEHGLNDGVEPDVPPALGRAFLRMAWLANFTMWFVGTSAVTVFPRLARGLGFSDGAIGEMTAVVWIGQVALFGLLATGAWWHYRKAALLLGLAAGLATTALFARGTSAAALVLASLLLGAARTPSHVGSMHYGLHAWGNRDANMGYHEAILGAGCVAGPVLSGIVADIGGVRAPFALCAGLIVLALLAVGAWPVRTGDDSR